MGILYVFGLKDLLSFNLTNRARVGRIQQPKTEGTRDGKTSNKSRKKR